VMVFTFSIARDGHTERGRKRGRSMARAKSVVFRLVTPEKPADAAVLFDRRQKLAASGQALVRVGLVADIPDEPIVRRVERVVQRDSQFDGAERGACVPAD